MEETKVNDAVRKIFEQLGIKEGQEYRVIFSKELRIEPIVPVLDLADVLPYPLKEKKGICPICQEDYATHNHLDYFVKPPHIRAIRNFLLFIRGKYDATQNMYFKLATESPDSVLSPKEMFLTLKEEGKLDPTFANALMPLLSHFNPSEDFHYQIKVGLGKKLAGVETHYRGWSRKWQTEFRIHKILESPQLLEEIEEIKEKEVVEKALGTKKDKEYERFLEEHEENDAKVDYENIQSDLEYVTSRILAYEKLLTKFTEMPRYGKIKSAISKKGERTVFPGFGYEFYPPLRRRRPIRI